MTRRDPETNPAAFLGEELRRARMAAGFSSQDALAARLGFDRTVVAKAETGQRPPTPDVPAGWCQACGLDDDLFGRLATLARRGDGPVPSWFEGWLDAEGAVRIIRPGERRRGARGARYGDRGGDGSAVADVVITGGAGFLGARLARQLLAAGSIEIAGGAPQPVSAVTLIDQVPPPADLGGDERVTVVQGDLGELLGPGAHGHDVLAGAEVIFHLAAAVSAECEADFDLGMRANLHATQALLGSCRALGTGPVVVYSSSLAVYGRSADHPLPPVVDDQTLPNPQSSYGAQKVIGEHLLADYTRKGFLRGRAVRLPTVSVRPGRPNGAASGFLSGIIREPLAGLRAVCPVDAATEVALISPARATDGLVCAATASDQAWGGRSAVTLPALTVTVADMAAALERAAGPRASALIDWVPDPALIPIVTSWPARIRAGRAQRLGLAPDPDFGSIIEDYLAGQPRH